MPSVLVVGYDPHRIPGVDGNALHAALAEQQEQFSEHGIEVATAIVVADESAEPILVAALSRHPWDVVVVGAGIRVREEFFPLFEQTVNLIHRHAPQAALAFNTHIGDTVEAARRWL